MSGRRLLCCALAALPLACAPSGDPGEAPAVAPRDEAARAPLLDAHGIDVSHHSGEVDWSAVVGADYDFVFLKASEGVDAPDPTFGAHWSALAGLPIHRGAYHFYVTEDDPEDQARLFLSQVEHRPGDLAPVVDVEIVGHGTEGPLAPRLRRFLEIVEGAVGVPPIIYTSPDFWDAHFGPGFGRHPLWIAEYGVEAPRVPAGWEQWTLWQFAGDAPVPGVEKSADLSRVHPAVDLESLRLPPPSTSSSP